MEDSIDFPRALQLVLHGRLVRRSDWNRPSHIEVMDIGGMTFLRMVMKNGISAPYTPSQCDIFAKDWVLIA